MISVYASMAMQPLLQAGLSTGVGLKKAESSFTASDLQTPSSAVTTLGNVSPHTLRGVRRSKPRRAARQPAALSDPRTPGLACQRCPRIPPTNSIIPHFTHYTHPSPPTPYLP